MGRFYLGIISIMLCLLSHCGHDSVAEERISATVYYEDLSTLRGYAMSPEMFMDIAESSPVVKCTVNDSILLSDIVNRKDYLDKHGVDTTCNVDTYIALLVNRGAVCDTFFLGNRQYDPIVVNHSCYVDSTLFYCIISAIAESDPAFVMGVEYCPWIPSVSHSYDD